MAVSDFPPGREGRLKVYLLSAAFMIAEFFTIGIMSGLATNFLEATRLGRLAVVDLGGFAAFILTPIKDAYLSDVFGALIGVVVVAAPTALWFYVFINSSPRKDNPFHVDVAINTPLMIGAGVALILAILDVIMIYGIMGPNTTHLPPGTPPPGLLEYVKPLGQAIIIVLVLQTIAFGSGAAYAHLTRSLSR